MLDCFEIPNLRTESQTVSLGRSHTVSMPLDRPYAAPRRAARHTEQVTDTTGQPREPVGGQDPGAFGVGRLFWLTSDAIVGADLSSGAIVLWNPAAAALFGYTADEAIGMPLEQLVPEVLLDRHLTGIARYRQGGEAVLVGGPPVEIPAVTKAGAVVDVALTLTDVSGADGDGDRRHILALIRDMTAIRASERDIQQAMDAMSEFVATASHDLRTPLTSVMGFAAAMLEVGDGLPVEKQRQFLEAIARGATQASRLVDDLLTLSQIQAGALPTHAQDVCVAAAVREALARTGVSASGPTDEHVTVRADPHHLERILVNYLTNATHYGADPIVVTADIEGAVVDIAVCDGGTGVPPEFVARLFTRFARADASRPDGTGLGLSIVRGLARANGGDTYYEPSADGCRFGVRLPSARVHR